MSKSFGSMTIDLTRSPTSELSSLYMFININLFKQVKSGLIHFKPTEELLNPTGKALSNRLQARAD